MPDTPYLLAQKFRAALLARDTKALREIAAAYDKVVASLQSSVSVLSAQADRTRAAGQTINPAWLIRERRLQLLLTQAEQQLTRFTAQAITRITHDQRAVVSLAQDHANQLLSATGAEFSFDRLPTAAIETLVGFSGDGSPLHKLLAKLPGDATARIRETLLTSLAHGINPRQTARQLRDALEGNKARALTIARTETLRAYREASRQTAANAGVSSWMWIASKSRRTCLSCLALDGQIFPIDKPQPSHPNCRCTVLYLPPGYNAPAREFGAQWFEKRPDEAKQRMMSKVAFEAYQRGDVKLQDFVGIKKSALWGETRYELSLKEMLRRKAEAAAKPKPVRKPRQPTAPKVAPIPTPAKLASRYDNVYLSAADTRVAIAQSAQRFEGELKSLSDALGRESKQFRLSNDVASRATHRKKMELLRGKIAETEKLRGAAVREQILVKDTDRATFKVKAATGLSASIADALDDYQAMIGKGLVDQFSVDVHHYEKAGRAYAQGNGIHLFGQEKKKTVVHEMGHWLENKVPSIKKAVFDFYAQRTKGDKLEKLKDLTGIKYRENEVAKKDKWINPYMGKWYAVGTRQTDTEILSMGLELMWEDAAKLAKQDPEFFDFIYDLIRHTPR